MRYLDVCSGISAPTCAWKPLGWEALAFSEIDKAPSAVLAHHYPDVPNLGDMNRFHGWPDYANIDVLVGGTPCQSFSIAGLRQGLADPRGNLMLTYLAIADRYRPRWLVWENVPGVLSSNEGRDFGSFLGALGKLGYSFAYRVLDAQYFGVAQRRARVFLIGYLGDWRRAASVLFEPESLRGNSSPSREKGEIVAALTSNGVGTCGADDNQGQGGHLIAAYGGNNTTGPIDVARACNAGGTLNTNSNASGRNTAMVAFAQNTRDELRLFGGDGDSVGALAAQPGMKQQTFIAGSSAVRRLTPRECERLQGFPEIEKCVTVRIWKDEDAKNEFVRSAEGSSIRRRLVENEPVAANVLIDLERSHLQIHNAGRLIWSASIAEKSSVFPLSIPAENFAQAVVHTITTAESEIANGRAELLQSISGSSVRQSGNVSVHVSGPEIVGNVEDAANFIGRQIRSTKSTILEVGLSSRRCELTSKILSCYVAHAISSCIPEAISTASSYALNLSISSGYTAVPYGRRGKLLADGPRYKALGNSMAVPVIRKIGQRIAMVEALK